MRLFLSLLTFIMVCRAKEIKVICYSGPGAGMTNVDVTNQIMCMGKGLMKNITFTAKRSETMHASDLKGYDIILAPGGEGGYDRYPEFDKNAVRAFVKAGGGYYGTCAGAHAGCLRTEADETGLINPSTGERVNATGFNETTGKPIYPAVQETGLAQAICHPFPHVGTADFSLTTHGQSILKQPAKVEIDHHNGPTMECVAGSTCETIATFATTSRKGSGAMVVDKYGSGPVILIAPHPEHPKDQNCEIVVRAAAYAGGAITRQQLTEG